MIRHANQILGAGIENIRDRPDVGELSVMLQQHLVLLNCLHINTGSFR